MFINALAIDAATSPATIYAGSGAGVFKSTDGGDTWQPQNTGLTNLVVLSLAITPSAPQVVYAGTAGGVFRSDNAAATWFEKSTGLGSQNVRGLAIDPFGATTILAATSNAGAFRSTSSGDTWAPVNTGLTFSVLDGITADPTSQGTFYTFTQIGMFKTINDGTNWSSAVAGITSNQFYSVVVDPTSGSDVVYAGVGGGGVFKSVDAAATWTHSSQELNAANAFAISIDPTDPGRVLAGLSQAGYIGRSTDGGGTWAVITDGLAVDADGLAFTRDPTAPSTVYLGTDEGLFKSLDGGTTWTLINTSVADAIIQALAHHPGNSGTLYAGRSGGAGVYKTTNGGANWDPAGTGLTNTDVQALAVDPANPNTVLAGTSGGAGIFKTTDGAVSWVPSNNGLTNTDVNALAIDPQTPSTIYAGTEGGGIFKSTDGGANWVTANTGLGANFVRGLAVDPNNPAVVYAATSAGIRRSINGGGSWTAMNSGLLSTATQSIAVAPSDSTRLYAAEAITGVYAFTLSDPDLQIAMVVSPDPAIVGQDLTYSITVTNGGPGAATGVVVSDTLAAALDFVSATSSAGTCTPAAPPLPPSRTVTCDVGSLATGASATVTITVHPTSAGMVSNQATVSGGQPDPVPANNSAAVSTTVQDVPDLTISKTHSSDFTVGTNGTYLLTVTNVGAGGTVGTITVTDTLPAGLSFVSGTGTGWSCGAVGQDVTCTHTAVIVPNTPRTISLIVNVGAAAVPGVTNTASVSGGGDTSSANNSDDDPTTVLPAGGGAPDLQLAKSHPGAFAVGASGVYTLAVTNVGTAPTSGTISLTDTLPNGLGFVSAVGAEWTCGAVGQVVTCTRAAALGIGASSTISLTVAVGAAAAPGVTNTAAVATAGDANAANDGASDPTSVGLGADLAVSIADAPDPVGAGQPLTYTVTVTNNGPSPASGVTLTDTLGAGAVLASAAGCSGTTVLTCPIGNLASGTSAQVTIVVTPGSPGPLSNVASVDGTESDPVGGNDSDSESTVVQGAAGPANDAFAAATPLSLPAPPIQQATSGASTEGGEPLASCAGSTGVGRTVWFRLSPTSTRKVTLTTAGSGFNTFLAVYTGAALGDLTRVACNDDLSQATPQAQVTFAALAGTTYHIQVGGPGAGDQGNLLMTVTDAAPDTCKAPKTPKAKGKATKSPPHTVAFSLKPKVGRGCTLQYVEWRFGAGALSSNLVISHTYAAAGTVQVTVRLIDSAGQSRTSIPRPQRVP